MNACRIQPHRTQRGFSLIELLVSLSIFAIIVVASTGALLTLIDVNAKAQALYTATTNLSFALDTITREIRMGYYYYCATSNDSPSQELPDIENTYTSDDYRDCVNPENMISFVRERDGWQLGYRYNTNTQTIEQKINEPGVTGGGDTGWIPVTSADEIQITQFSVEVSDSEPYCLNQDCTSTGDNNQPTVQLRISGSVQNGMDTNTELHIQTNIIQRRNDIR